MLSKQSEKSFSCRRRPTMTDTATMDPVAVRYMRRAIQLARQGSADTSPNPMVGAVVVGPDGRIIGEGFHRRCGEGHAEVNAIASVAQRSLLPLSTIYVTLEPCSHYGKTPPCARLIIDSRIPRVVVGMSDPNPLVAGRGIDMLRSAGCEVVCGILEDECKSLNAKFIKAFSTKYPFIGLKYAQSADCKLDRLRLPQQPAERFSTPLTTLLVHRQRALYDAVMVGSGTVLLDNPRLNVRSWDGRQPLKVVLDRRGRVPADARLFTDAKALVYSAVERPDLEAVGVEVTLVLPDAPLEVIMADLRSRGVTSVLVEGGPALHQSLIDSNLWDSVRIETAPWILGRDGRGTVCMPYFNPVSQHVIDNRLIQTFCNINY